jgi:hypothetical protein
VKGAQQWWLLLLLRFVQRTANFANLPPSLSLSSGLAESAVLQNRTKAHLERIIGKLSSKLGREWEEREGTMEMAGMAEKE